MVNLKPLLALLLILTGHLAADDTELFVTDLPAEAQPNVLFIMDTSGSMNINTGPETCIGISILKYCYSSGPTRMDVAKNAAKSFIQSAENINISLMSFNRDEGGKIDFASEDIDTGRQEATDVIDGYSPGGLTPLSESLYEAFLYFSGATPKFGSDSVSDALHGSKYRSPIVNECQKSSVVLFTDGAAYLDNNADGNIQALIRGKSLPAGLSDRCSGDGECLDEMAWYLLHHDIYGGIQNNQNVNTYTIAGFGSAPPDLLTRAANFGGGEYYEAGDENELTSALADIMIRVNSESTSFATPTVSVSAFNALETAEDVYYTVFEPTTGPDWKGNLKRYRLGDDNRIYDADGQLAIDPATGSFLDNARSFWSSAADGNAVGQGGVVDRISQNRPVFTNISGDNNVMLRGSGNRLHEHNFFYIPGAMLGVENFLEKMILLMWVRGVDVDDQDGDGSVTDTRTSIGDPIHTRPEAITYYKNDSGSVDKTIFFTTNDGFLHGVNADNGNTEFSFIPTDLLGNQKVYREGRVMPVVPPAGPTSDSQCVWNYQMPGACVPARWCEERFEWGDIHFSQSCRLIPPIPQSDDDCDWDWSNARCANPDYCEWDYNGHLVGNSVCDWNGKLAPVPPEPDPGPAKIYGMDGPMTVWVNDGNGDGDVLMSHNGSPDSGEHVYLYLTMRRGGSNIYALDITQRDSPILKWVIRGDLDKNNQVDSVSANPDFPELGQTWSKLKLTKVKWQGQERQVLLFGGGYDQDADTQSQIAANDIGRAIYMVDAETGTLLWSAGKTKGDLLLSEMEYSIPAELTLIDIDQDGLTDYFFAADIGGQLIRMDINSGNTWPGNFATGGVIARLAGNRRFFESPAVAIAENRQYLHIAIGSGTRPNPMGTKVQDRMYVIRDPNVYNKPAGYRYAGGSIITESSLYDATANLIQQGSDVQRSAELVRLESRHGWYINLEDHGEKVLSKAAIVSGVLLFSSFVPNISGANSCAPGTGLNYFYALNIENGGAVVNFDSIGNPGTPDRRMLLQSKALAPEPSIISRGNKTQVCVGTQCLPGDILQESGNRVKRTFWRENR